jgi:hypothetical protein
MFEVLVRINEELIHSHNLRAAAYPGHDRCKRPHRGFDNHPRPKNSPDNALVHKFLVELQLTLLMQYGQLGGGPGTARRSANSAFSKKHHVLNVGFRIFGCPAKFHVSALVNEFLFRMLNRYLRIDDLFDFSAKLNDGIGISGRISKPTDSAAKIA